MKPLIEARDVSAGYGDATVIRDISLEVWPGEVVALLGPNGAGKTTTIRTLAGVVKPQSGRVLVEGVEARGPLHQRARSGLAYVPEERSVFSTLSTRQNVALGRGAELSDVVELFPALRPLLDRPGGLLSGGEQQMLTVGRALARPTSILLADELSLGLAPKTVGSLLAAVRTAADEGLGVLVVEQHIHRVLEIADRVYVLRHGRIEMAASVAELDERRDEIQDFYLAGGSEGHGLPIQQQEVPKGGEK